MQASTRVVIIYDGIENSVFASQVFNPIVNFLSQDPENRVVLVTFEYKPQQARKQIPPADRLNLIIIKKNKAAALGFLRPCIGKLRAILRPLNNYKIVARGPLAGLIALKARPAEAPLTIQARGLLAQEYAYTHATARYIKKLFFSLRTRIFDRIERAVYTYQGPDVIVEAVSPALKEYIHTQFGLDKRQITLAADDIPAPIQEEQRIAWRSLIRLELGIAPHTHIYCYNGSAKPWQCPHMVIDFFKEELKKNCSIFLLILTQDKSQFDSLLEAGALNSYQYLVLCVPHAQVIKYLAASDTGIIFRQAHIINWISRPTKMLEYYAAQLPVVHNGTIAWLCEPTAPAQAAHTQTQSQKTTGLDHSIGF